MDLNKVISDHLARGEKGALATITEKVGAASGDEGARMFVTSEGRVYGTIGGGLLEADRRLLNRPRGHAWQSRLRARRR